MRLINHCIRISGTHLVTNMAVYPKGEEKQILSTEIAKPKEITDNMF